MSLFAFVNEFHAELEFDWWERGQDFNADMWGARCSLRKIWVIIQHLPADSAVGRRVNPEQWRAEHRLLADIYDTLAAGNWQRGGDANARRPEPYPRPGQAAEVADRQAERIEQELARRARQQQGS